MTTTRIVGAVFGILLSNLAGCSFATLGGYEPRYGEPTVRVVGRGEERRTPIEGSSRLSVVSATIRRDGLRVRLDRTSECRIEQEVRYREERPYEQRKGSRAMGNAGPIGDLLLAAVGGGAAAWCLSSNRCGQTEEALASGDLDPETSQAVAYVAGSLGAAFLVSSVYGWARYAGASGTETRTYTELESLARERCPTPFPDDAVATLRLAGRALSTRTGVPGDGEIEMPVDVAELDPAQVATSGLEVVLEAPGMRREESVRLDPDLSPITEAVLQSLCSNRPSPEAPLFVPRGGVDLRSRPGADATLVGRLTEGAVDFVICEQGGWVATRIGGALEAAYVARRQLLDRRAWNDFLRRERATLDSSQRRLDQQIATLKSRLQTLDGRLETLRMVERQVQGDAVVLTMTVLGTQRVEGALFYNVETTSGAAVIMAPRSVASFSVGRRARA